MPPQQLRAGDWFAFADAGLPCGPGMSFGVRTFEMRADADVAPALGTVTLECDDTETGRDYWFTVPVEAPLYRRSPITAAGLRDRLNALEIGQRLVVQVELVDHPGQPVSPAQVHTVYVDGQSVEATDVVSGSRMHVPVEQIRSVLVQAATHWKDVEQ
ncbi:hypothetical protein [Streptacidiphilus cavernicola]|uniref:Uncharacterized protein n=1 Tax=Streptacidiphilus cavernicola TaxID=3342716 RepID=A0ABV6VYE6_9ACTN